MRSTVMWFTLPTRYVSLKTASALCDSRHHIGKEVVAFRSIRDFTIWRVADVCLAPHHDAVEVRFELVVGRGKDHAETLFSYGSWSQTSLTRQFKYSYVSGENPLIEAMRSGAIIVYVVYRTASGKIEKQELDPTYWWIDMSFDALTETTGPEYSVFHNEEGYDYERRAHEVRLWGEKLPGVMFVERSDLERLFPRAENGLTKGDELVPQGSGTVARDSPRGRPPRYDAEAFLIEAFRVLFEGRIPDTQGKLLQLALDAYEERGFSGGRPSEEWAKVKIRNLCRELEVRSARVE